MFVVLFGSLWSLIKSFHSSKKETAMSELVVPKISISRALTVANAIADTVIKEFAKGRTGGYLYGLDEAERPLFLQMINHPDEAQVLDYHRNAMEKAHRLHTHWDHLLSRESRNVAANQYAGALKLLNGSSISFSGFPEDVDEAYCGIVAVLSGEASPQYIYQIFQERGGNVVLFENMIDVVTPIWEIVKNDAHTLAVVA